MALAPHHTFQALTKRSERARKYLNASHHMVMTLAADRAVEEGLTVCLVADPAIEPPSDLSGPRVRLYHWPLSNVWLGTSISDQASAEARVPDLLATPAAVRFLSAEPLLGPVDLPRALRPACDRCPPWETPCRIGCEQATRLDLVIVGGESGPGARPMHPDWSRDLRDQCTAAGVPFFFKQWGEWAPNNAIPVSMTGQRKLIDGGTLMIRTGKRAAGPLLDGLEWSQMPGVTDA